MSVYRARLAKAADFDRRTARSQDAQALAIANAEYVARHPRIGTLIRNGKPVYYAYTAEGRYQESADPRTLIDQA